MNPYEPSNVSGEILRIDWLRRIAIGGRCVSLGCLAFGLSLYGLFVQAWYLRLAVGYPGKLPEEFGFVPFATACLIAAIILWRHSPVWRINPRRAAMWTIVAVSVLFFGNVAGNYGWHRILM